MKRTKKVLSLLLAVLLAASLLPVTASAAGSYEAADSYVLNYNGVYTGSKWQYFSPYWAAWTYEGSADNQALIAFSLYNTLTGARIPAYCTDIATGLDSDSDFRRMNLEDSTYADSNAAGQLRSVMLKGFPNTSVEALAAAAGVDGLTVGEAVSATQLAVWQLTHGDRVEFTDFCYYIDTEWAEDATEFYADCIAEINSGYASEDNEALIESHIKAVFDYLTTLAPTAPTGVAVSNASFTSWSESPTVTANEDGTYNVTVEATVNVEMTAADALTLSAVLGDGTYYASAALSNGANTKTLTIEHVPADIAHGDVTLAIDGTQTVSDVFLFDAQGDRSASQSLIGVDNSQLPVHAQVTIEAERILNFYKTTKVVTGTDDNGEAVYTRLPLEGIVFDIYLAATMEEYQSGTVTLPEAADYAYGSYPDYTVTTDSDGRAVFNLTKNNMPDGVYLIVEQANTAIVAPADPFYVTIPMTSTDGSSLIYEVTVEPKNEVQGEVDIEKDVISLGNDEASVDAYAAHTWIIGATIPLDIADGKEYIISDTLDNRLDYLGNLKVQVETADGSAVMAQLTADTHYVLTVTDNDSLTEGKPSDAFTVSLTALGMKKIADAIGEENYGNYMLRVYFDAQINANATVGEQIPNQAELDYTNSVGFDFAAESDEPYVYTGGIGILKVDAADNTPLAGAEFTVYRAATEEEIAAGGDDLVWLDGVSGAVVPAAFFSTTGFTGEKVTGIVSADDGTAYVYGLAYGTYYLVETKAPGGYNLLTGPVELTIDEDSHLETGVVTVLNRQGIQLPDTGGIGTTVFTVSGLGLMLGAAVLLLRRRKMETE